MRQSFLEHFPVCIFYTACHKDSRRSTFFWHASYKAQLFRADRNGS